MTERGSRMVALDATRIRPDDDVAMVIAGLLPVRPFQVESLTSKEHRSDDEEMRRWFLGFALHSLSTRRAGSAVDPGRASRIARRICFRLPPRCTWQAPGQCSLVSVLYPTLPLGIDQAEGLLGPRLDRSPGQVAVILHLA